MFDNILDNKLISATIITSTIGVVLIAGCCCVKRCVYKKLKPKQEKGRERLESKVIQSRRSAFTAVQPSAPPMDNTL